MPEGFSTALAGALAAPLPARLDEDFPAGFAADLAAGFAVCGAGLAADVGAGLAGACVAGFAGGLVVCCAVCPLSPSADFKLFVVVAGFTCARNPGAVAPIKSPSPTVIAERISSLIPALFATAAPP